jgi:hypothetical protein
MKGGAIDMSKPVYYRLPTGQWRVTAADDDWRDDGITYPESNLDDQYFDKEEDAQAAWRARLPHSSTDSQ